MAPGTTSLYLVRHGQTAWNREEIFRGRTDVPLNETGLREAELAGEYFRGRMIDGVYSSPLARARMTAEKIAKVLHLGVVPLPEIIDMSFGSWEGRSLREVKGEDGERYRQWQEAPHRVQIPDGETLDEVRSRVMAALQRVIACHPTGAVVLVTHRVINKVIICAILGLDNSHFWQIGQDTTAINLIRHASGRFVLSLLNEACHLKPLRQQRIDIDF
jgi:broad specificity phosphatase PhoE